MAISGFIIMLCGYFLVLFIRQFGSFDERANSDTQNVQLYTVLTNDFQFSSVVIDSANEIVCKDVYLHDRVLYEQTDSMIVRVHESVSDTFKLINGALWLQVGYDKFGNTDSLVSRVFLYSRLNSESNRLQIQRMNSLSQELSN
jgi:hypothetical protein